jgi:dienelactone hydrolase
MERSMLVVFLSGALTLSGAGCAKSAAVEPLPSLLPSTATLIPPTSTPTVSFNYDASIPFDIKVNSESERDGITVVDLSYAAHDPSFSPSTGGRTLAYLVKPHGEGPCAGIIYLHWLGAGNSNRGEFLDEAVEMAKRGVVSLLLQGYFPWMSLPTGERDRPLIVGQLTELRRAIDFLLIQPGVDPDRLGFVGHDYGAAYGGVLAGVDHRIKTYILAAGTPSFADWIVYFGYPREAYDPFVRDLDPIRYIPHAAPATVLFQFSEGDAFVPKEKAISFFNAASEPKKIEWFDDTHQMISQAVRQARQEWLTEQLRLNPSAKLIY